LAGERWGIFLWIAAAAAAAHWKLEASLGDSVSRQAGKVDLGLGRRWHFVHFFRHGLIFLTQAVSAAEEEDMHFAQAHHM
jgi:hypothetical protein